MNYPLRSKTRKQHKSKQLVFLLFILSATITIRFFVPQILSNTFFSTAHFMWNVRDTIEERFVETIHYFYSKTLLMKENSSLKEHIMGQNNTTLQNRILRAENAQLRELLGRKTYSTSIVAGVLAKPPRTFFDIILIDAGKKEGITKGMLVVSGEIFIGQVIEVSEDVSKISLYSLGNQIIEGIIYRTNAAIALKGKGGGNFETEVPRSFDIEIGDTLSMPGFDGALIAEVFTVDTDSTAAFKKVLLKSPVNLNTLRFVEVCPIAL